MIFKENVLFDLFIFNCFIIFKDYCNLLLNIILSNIIIIKKSKEIFLFKYWVVIFYVFRLSI